MEFDLVLIGERGSPERRIFPGCARERGSVTGKFRPVVVFVSPPFFVAKRLFLLSRPNIIFRRSLFSRADFSLKKWRNKKTVSPGNGPPLPRAPGKKYAVRANPALRFRNVGRFILLAIVSLAFGRCLAIISGHQTCFTI